MANTVIELKHSQTPGNTPVSLANGEISINTYDGKIFYKDSSGVIRVYTKYPGPSGLDTEVQFNDGGSLGANASLSFNKSTGTLSTKLLSITNSVGDEGGEILLAKPVTNTTLGGTGIVVDSYQNKIRFFEQGGSARGAYIDLTECSGGAGTNLLNPGATPDSVARATANSAYEKANAAYDKANSANVLAQSAYDKANTDTTNITLASPGVYGNSTIVPIITVAANGRISEIANVSISFPVTSVAGVTGAVSNTNLLNGIIAVDGIGSGLDADLLDGLQGSSYANSNFAQAGYDRANSANVLAQSAYDKANTDTTNITLASPGIYGNTSILPIVTVAANGRISGIANATISIAASQVASGTLPIARGGTNQTTFVTGNLVFFNGTSLASLANTGTAGTYGNTSIIPVITTDAFGRVTSVTNVAVSAGSTITVSDNTSTNSDAYYPTLSTSTSGSLSALNVSSTKLYYNPSTGTLNSTNYNTLSDITLKENIDPIFNALTIIDRLNPVNFNWKDNGVKAYGVIAQEIEQVLPNIVETKNDGIKSVSYIQLIPILIQAIKEQQKEINKLKKGKK